MLRPWILPLLLLGSLPLAPVHAEDAPYEGIRWETGLDAGLQRAAREGRPILFCVNALYGSEGANTMLGDRLYRSAPWGEATRAYVAFPCNPETRDRDDGTSRIYEGTTSATAKDALDWVIARFGKDLISPQHIIVDPDGSVVYRKEYYTRVVGPDLLRRWLVRTSPPWAIKRAGIEREERIDALEKTPTEELAEAVRTWVKTDDPYAVAGVLDLLQGTFQSDRSLEIATGLLGAKAMHALVLAHGAMDKTLWPDEAPKETEAWVRAVQVAEANLGRAALARAIGRSEKADLRRTLLEIWTGEGKGLSSLDGEERTWAAEALTLAQDARAPDARRAADGAQGAWARRLARAAGEPVWPELGTALTHERVAVVRGALLEATREEIEPYRDRIRDLVLPGGPGVLQRAAALALLRGGEPQDQTAIQTLVLDAVFDPLVGPDLRAHAEHTLGIDPGEDPAMWAQAMSDHLHGGAR